MEGLWINWFWLDGWIPDAERERDGEEISKKKQSKEERMDFCVS